MYRITITAGTMYDAEGAPLDPYKREVALDAIRKTMAEVAGGYTESDTYGGWLKDGRLVQEPGKRWAILTGDDKLGQWFAETVRTKLHQRAVALEVEALQQAALVPEM